MKIPVKDFFQLLWTYLRPQWQWVAILSLALLTNVGLALFTPQILKQFIDSVASMETMEKLTSVALLFILASLAKRLFDVAVSYLSAKVGWTAANALREDLVSHSLALDMGFHHKHTPGEMIERIDGDVKILNNFFSLFVIQIVGNTILLCGIIVIVWREHWQIGLAFALFSAVTLFVCNSLRHKGVPLQVASRKANAKVFGFLEERISATEDISSCGASPFILRRFLKLSIDWFRKDLKAALFMHVMLNIAWALFYIANAAALGLGAYFYLSGVVSIGFVYLLYQYASMLRRPIEQFVHELENLMKAGASIARLREIKDAKSAVDEGRGAAMPSGALSVTFDEVSFSYDKKKSALKDVSFALASGKTLGLVGRTGCGKTTLSRLLFRFYDPDAGSVRLSDLDVKEPYLRDLRRHVSLVTQNIQLFAGSVRDNLSFFDKTIDDARIFEALRELGLEEWLTGLPEGLDSRIGSGGAGLSAGEGQLLALARVLLKDDAGLVVLDEPSSRLDKKSEFWIQRAMRRLVRDRTAIIIAHHLSTLDWVDEIMVMDGGRIVELGERKALLSKPDSRFAEMLNKAMEVEGA